MIEERPTLNQAMTVFLLPSVDWQQFARDVEELAKAQGIVVAVAVHPQSEMFPRVIPGD